MPPKVSVVIPTYNRGEVIGRAVDSVIRQTYQNWELFIVDDGSTDNTKEIIEEKYLEAPRITWVERPDSRTKGANACRNIGIEKATGEYIALLDSDDEWKNSHLGNCIDFAKSVDFFNGSYSNSIEQRGPFLIERTSRIVNEDESYLDFLLGDGFAQTPSYFLKAELAKMIKFDESLQRHQDWDFFIRFADQFDWSFNPSMDVIVHRGIKEKYQNINFDSCIQFYKKYEDQITNIDLKINYLSFMYVQSSFTDNKSAIAFYNSQLKKINKSNRVSNTRLFLKKARFKAQQHYVFGFLKHLIKKFVKALKIRKQ